MSFKVKSTLRLKKKQAEAEKAEVAARAAEEKVNALVQQRSEIHEEVTLKSLMLHMFKLFSSLVCMASGVTAPERDAARGVAALELLMSWTWHSSIRVSAVLSAMLACLLRAWLGLAAGAPPYAAVPSLTQSAHFKLHDGRAMPVMGLGVYMSQPGDETFNAVAWALEAGYRMIDTAAVYGNEESVGEALLASRVPRSEVFLTTKLWDADHGYKEAVMALETSLKKLKTDYLDLYLIHSPNTGKIVETWDPLLDMQKLGKIRSIGVSNFGVPHLEALKSYGRPMPTVNQIEMHPMNYQDTDLETSLLKNSPLKRCFRSAFLCLTSASAMKFWSKPTAPCSLASQSSWSDLK